jgi:hypothetical protein
MERVRLSVKKVVLLSVLMVGLGLGFSNAALAHGTDGDAPVACRNHAAD